MTSSLINPSAYGIATEERLGLVNGDAFRQFQTANQMQNFLINGAFDFWQRGTSSPTTGTYGADRFIILSHNTGYAKIDSALPEGFTSAIQIGTSVATYASVAQRIESANASLLIGKQITLSFWVKAISGTPDIFVNYYAATAKDVFTSMTDFGANNVGASTTEWKQYSYTTTLTHANVANGIQVRFGILSAIGTIQITGCMLNIGSEPAPFSRAGGTIGGELALCQRYYWRTQTGVNVRLAWGFAYNTSLCTVGVTYPVTMFRSATPDFGGTAANYAIFYKSDSVSIRISTMPSLNTHTKDGMNIISTVTGTPLTAGEGCVLVGTSTAGYLGFDAEL